MRSDAIVRGAGCGVDRIKAVFAEKARKRKEREYDRQKKRIARKIEE